MNKTKMGSLSLLYSAWSPRLLYPRTHLIGMCFRKGGKEGGATSPTTWTETSRAGSYLAIAGNGGDDKPVTVFASRFPHAPIASSPSLPSIHGNGTAILMILYVRVSQYLLHCLYVYICLASSSWLATIAMSRVVYSCKWHFRSTSLFRELGMHSHNQDHVPGWQLVP
jgi:hypothetical protein